MKKTLENLRHFKFGKKILIIVIVLSMLLCSIGWIYPKEATPNTSTKIGDLNGDNDVTLGDAQTALRASLRIIDLTDRQEKLADANGDGKITLKDAQLILKMALGIIPTSDIDEELIINEEPKSNAVIIDQYTDKKVTDGDSAIASLNDVADVLGITDVNEEFEVERETDISWGTSYRLRQKYEGIPFWGHSIIVQADKYGNVSHLTSYYEPISLNTIPKIDEEEAKQSVKEHINTLYKTGADWFSIKEIELIIYSDSFGGEPTLTWRVKVEGSVRNGGIFNDDLFINANNKELINKTDNIMYLMKETKVKGQDNEEHIIQADYTDETYYMRNFSTDEESGVSVSTINPFFYANNKWLEYPSEGLSYVSWKEGKEANKSAVDAFVNINTTHDFYKYILNRDSWDNKGGHVFAIVNMEYNPSTSLPPMFKEAFSKDNVIGFTTSAILPSSHERSALIDVVAHEFAHMVFNAEVGLNKEDDEAYALNEAYSDIFGCLVEDYATNEGNDWIIAPRTTSSRNIKEPAKTFNPNHYLKFKKGYDPHYNSTIISHAAYLMWNGGKNTGDWTRIDDTKTLAKIWYNSLSELGKNSKFIDCRNAVVKSAEKLYRSGEITEGELQTVSKAFEAVGLGNASNSSHSHYHRRINGNFNLNVYDIMGNVDSNYHLKIEDPRIGNLSKGVVFNDEVKTDNKLISSLDDGNYILTITNSDNPNQKKVMNISVYNSNNSADKVDVFTNFTNHINFNERQYQIIEKGMSWHEAKAYCEELGGHLATITSQEEQDFINNLIKNSSKSHLWIGATDEEQEGNWKWITGEEFNYNNWGYRQPNNWRGQEHYAAIVTRDVMFDYMTYLGEWNDWTTTWSNGSKDDFGFICEWSENTIIPSDTTYIENLTPINSDRYTGNQGDSFINKNP